MKNPTVLIHSLLLLGFVSMGWVGIPASFAQDAKPDISGEEKHEKNQRGPHSDEHRKGPDRPEPDKLTPEEEKRIRRVLAEAWEDPGVVEAKEQVRQAMENYRTALKQAVVTIDPEAAELMSKMYESSRAHAIRQRMGSPFGGRGRGGRPDSPKEFVFQFLRNDPVFREVPPEERGRLYRIGTQVGEGEAVKDAYEEIRKTEDTEEKERKRRDLRKLIFEEMKKHDPWVGEIVPHPPGSGPERGPAPPPVRPDLER